MADLPDSRWREHPRAGEYAHLIDAAEQAYDLPRGLLGALTYRESRFNPDAVSPAGAVGLVQLMPIHNEAVGDPRDPTRALNYGAKELARLNQRFGSWDKALAAYNWGEGNLSEALETRGSEWKSALPEETSEYIAALTPPVPTLPDDDLGTEHLQKTPEDTQQLLDRLRAKEAAEREKLLELKAQTEEELRLEEAERLREENKQQLVDDLQERAFDITVRAPVKAAVDLVNETLIAAKDLANWILPVNSLVYGVDADQQAQQDFNADLRRNADELVHENTTGAGRMVKETLQFVAGYAGATRALMAARGLADVGSAGALTDSALGGILVDYGMFDPNDEGLSNLIQSYPALKNPITEFLATDPGDSDIINRTRRALEGAGLGVATDGLLEVLGLMRSARGAKAQRKEFEETVPDEGMKLPPEPAKEPARPTDDAAEKPAEAKTADGVEEPATQSPSLVEKAQQIVDRDKARRAIRISQEKREALTKAIMNGELSKARELIDFNGDYVDFAFENLDKDGDPRGLLNTFSEILRDEFDGIPRSAPIPFSETASRARALGMSQNDVARVWGKTKGLDHEILAADLVMHASGARLQRLAREAKALNSDTLEGVKARAEVAKQVQIHAALMAEVKQAKREVARALSAMRILKAPDEELFRDFDGLQRQFSGATPGGRDEVLDRIIGAKTTRDVHLVARKYANRKWTDILSEVVINGMLSGVKTHVVNIASNSLMVGFGAIDRAIAATLVAPVKRAAGAAMGRKVEAYEARQALAYYQGLVHGMRDGLKAAGQALKTRAPVTDNVQRIETINRRAIYVDPSNLTGAKKVMAKGINVLGEIVRAPGVALLASDELFKGIARRASMQENSYLLAARQADLKGVKGAARTKFISKKMEEIRKDPSHELQNQITLDARYATFQESATTSTGRNMERFVNSHPIIKLVIAPFFKTPMNILRQSFVDRTPLAVFNKQLREDIAAGGVKGDIALSRVFTGVSAFTAGYFALAATGRLTGKDSYKNTEKLDNIPEYSVKLGDTWYQFNRLDPIGSWLGSIADFNDYVRANYDPDDPESVSLASALFGAFVTALSRNALSKTWARSLNDILDVADTKMTAGEDAQEMQERVMRLLAGQTGKLIPFSGALRGIAGQDDPVTRDAHEFFERISRGLPGAEDKLPPVRDWLGREVPRNNAENFWWNPIQAAPDTTDPLEKELTRLAFDYQPLPRSISVSEAGSVKLSTEQYSEYKRLIGQEPYRIFGGKTLEQYMREYVQSDEYKSLTDDAGDLKGGKHEVIGRLHSAAKAEAKARLLEKYPELQLAIVDKKTQRANLLAPR